MAAARRLPRKYRRCRPRRKAGSREALAVAGIVVALAVATGHHQGAGGRAAAAGVPAVAADGTAYTPQSWAVALLSAGGWPRTACNAAAVTAWENAEGGNWGNAARYNPLDTTQPEPGSWPVNSAGVQGYPSWASGFRATLTTLGNGRYGAILSALSAGDDARAVAGAVAASPWGTGPFTASCT
jgi:hypothetical protein